MIEEKDIQTVFAGKLERGNVIDNPLHYQLSEYDCGPTSILAGISYLFSRSQIPPELIRNIILYTLDSYNQEGVMGKSGTSHAAMMFLGHWINQFGKTGQLNISSQYISERSVYLGDTSYLNDAIKRGGVAILRLFLDEWHYVLLTGIDKEYVYLFDPYYQSKDFEVEGVEIDLSHPSLFNRRVLIKRLNQSTLDLYHLGPYENREALILYNEDIRKRPEETIEYFI